MLSLIHPQLFIYLVYQNRTLRSVATGVGDCLRGSGGRGAILVPCTLQCAKAKTALGAMDAGRGAARPSRAATPRNRFDVSSLPQPGIFRGQVAASRPFPSFASESGELRVRRARSSQPKDKEQSSAVAVNRSLTRASLNSKLVNGDAAELFPVTLCLKSRLYPRKGKAPRLRCEGE